MVEHSVKSVETAVLRIAYVEQGHSTGWPVILSHGFPYDVHAFDDVASILAQAGARVIVPYARGFGPTRFISDDAIRSGQQAARGADIIQLADGLGLQRPILGGFDWGGNAACSAAALWPDKIGGLVSYAGYDIIDVSAQRHANAPSFERVVWYQHLFQTERGRECLAAHRRDLCRMLWEEWSPGWHFDDATFARSAISFDNPDFVDIVIHCYRWIFGLERGDRALQPLEDRLAEKPVVTVPTVTIDGTTDPLKPGGTADHARMFVGPHEHRVVNAGHNLPQQAPEAFADAVMRVQDWLA
ncbi:MULTISPECIES: alpha/beta hydrolase [Rhodopseudomonas]|uniref:Alpha/beta hydrolase n=1 Tax=Rhodopseudomonas palustris TaxID=1076 RepID=A0A0D7F2M3_RHOPL|nr:MULTISPECIES: alpha/beta hydrolase [Rhodopseudomonas]KIZ47284.1 alpha/beta hydrolase [Rhodopseudomonas palustris]MDF3811585.1 alpha/beta hydrolase [Rhodopseudomonas sp. BAL398]WOK19908.1 alpha/beta hydrolase [Rhodopseudomonas sp. BAL398]